MQMFTFLVWSAHIVQIFASSKDEKPKSGWFQKTGIAWFSTGLIYSFGNL
jgi:hypothetical protein